MFAAQSRVRCPHCQVHVKLESVTLRQVAGGNMGKLDALVFDAPSEHVMVYLSGCPHCGKVVIAAQTGTWSQNTTFNANMDTRLLLPFMSSRPPAPTAVPPAIAADYTEAALVLPFSPKASAALSRRCVQAVLRGAGYAQHDLAKQIDAAMPSLPSYLASSIDAIRVTGNFAAHEIKSTASGEIVDVEPEEAEWNLEVLDMLFDFFYVQPALAQQKRDELNAKLAAAGKPLMK